MVGSGKGRKEVGKVGQAEGTGAGTNVYHQSTTTLEAWLQARQKAWRKGGGGRQAEVGVWCRQKRKRREGGRQRKVW